MSNIRNIFANIFGFIRKNKWMVAFIATAIALVAATTVAIVIGVSSRPDPEPEYFEGDEAGIYYYDVADGEILLTLSGNNSFTLAGPQINKTGTYTIDAEGNMVLDYVRDEDGTENAKLTGTTILLQKGNATMPFLKKIDFTVTFNANEGSTVSPVTVVNGKTVVKPVDPTKEGYAFLGWYSDSELKNAFDFTSATVTKNITLYAKWVHDQVGVGKYNIDFEVGDYDGAPTYENITTISGLAYGVPTPTRQGYTFGGWWISMYEDGSKLSYEYTEATVFDADTTLYAVWIEDSADKLPSPMATVSNNTIKWSAVPGATVYTIVITDPAGNEVLNETIGATTINFDFAQKAAGDYVISVVAVAQNAANNSDATVRYIANKSLAKVSQFQVIDGILIFNPVNGATSYVITVDCGNNAHKHTNFDNGASTSFSLMNCPMQEGGIKITVTAKASGYASSVSETYIYNKVLDAIGNVVYNAQTDTFVWNAVPAATSYVVTVKVGENTYTFDNGSSTSFSVAGFTGDITVSVKPVNAGYNSPAATTATCSKVAPAAPSNVTVNGMTVTWDAAEGAESYEIKIGDVIRTVNGTSYDLTDEALTAGQTYAISVKSIKGAESSAYTKAITFGYKVMNTTLTYKDKTVYWTPVIGVTTYEVKVNGVVVKENVTASYAEVKLTREGINTIEVRYTDVAGSATAKIEVVAHAVSYYPRNNTEVITEYYAVGDTMTLPRDITYAGYDFEDWYTSPNGAAGNGKLYAEGSVFSEYGSIALFADWTPKTYQISVQVDASYGINNIIDKTNYPATYTQGFTLPVPTLANTESLVFAGWFDGPGGTGTQLTDANGNSVISYPYPRDTVAYPYFKVILAYTLQPDNTYAVKAGLDFDSEQNVVIPTTYLGIPVTTVLENAFASRRNLVTISIPDTIELVGVGALSGCSNLEYIDIYEVNGIHEKHYASDNGALIHYDGDAVYLEVVPKKMKADNGVYTMSDEVQYIVSRAFQYTDLDKLIIGKGVINIAQYAFYQAHMVEIEFAEGRTESVSIANTAFYDNRYLTDIKLPSKFTVADGTIVTLLDSIKKLASVTVDPASKDYNSVDGLLTSFDRTKLEYVPLTTAGKKVGELNNVFTVPAGIKTIGDKVFINRVNIKHIVIPTFVTKIGEQAFAGCTSVESITFGGNGSRMSNLEIGSQAFAGLPALRKITFKGNTEGNLETGSIKIGASAFIPDASGTVLTELIFENGVNISEIGTSAFANQTKLLHFTYGNNTVIGKIGASAFSNNDALKNLTVPKSVTEIGSNAFEKCDNLSSVTILEGDTEISLGASAFKDCSNLRSITLPKTVTNFNGSAFAGCNNLMTIDVDDDNPHLYSDDNGILYNAAKTKLLFYPKALIRAEIKDQDGVTVIKGAGVVNNLISTLTEIDSSAFASNTDLVSITLPAGVNKIGANAFDKCSALETVIFATNGTAATSLEIGNSAFNKCTKLTYGGTNTGITLPAYTTKIGTSAFAGCTSLVTLALPANVTEIGGSAFSGCTGITSLTLPANVTKIGDSAFSGCTGITAIDLPAKLTSIGKTAFKGIKITSLVIPTNVTSIGAGAFEGCTLLATVTVTPFAQTETFKALTLGDTSASTGVFKGCTALTSVDLGDRVTTIGNYTFSGCTNASLTVDLGAKVTTIGKEAFSGVKFTTITIPKTVTTIGDGAFKGTTLDEILFEMGGTEKLSIEANAFANQEKVTSITFPARLNSIYTKKTASNLEYTDVDTRFTGMTALKTINVEVLSGVTAKFSAKEGILYENDKNGNPVTLLYCPAANEGTNKTVTIPKTVTYVMRGAFVNISKLTTVIFEEYETTDTAHYGKPLLTIGNDNGKITSAPSSTNMGLYTVFGGKATNTITSISFPSHLAVLGPIAVGNTNSNISISFGACTDVAVGAYAFTGAKFQTISIPGVSSIGKGAFTKCTTATSISFTTNSAMTDIPQELFSGCTSLSSYTVPASIKEINSKAFYGCTGLTNLTFATNSKLKTIHSSAFEGCTGLTTVDLTPCTDLESLGGEYKSVTNTIQIGGKVFSGCTNLTSVNLTGLTKLTQIGYETFAKTGLTGFTLPASVEELGRDVFQHCASLESITLYGNFTPTMLEINKFFGCTKLKTVNFVDNPYFSTDEYGAIYDSAKTILYRFLEGAPITVEIAGEQVTYSVPATVKTISSYAFAFYAGTSITLPEGLETIGDCAFFHHKFTTIKIPASVKTIGERAFSVTDDSYVPTDAAGNKYYANYVNQLTKVEFGENSQLTSIGEYAFTNAALLTNIDLPDLVEFIGRNAFQDCQSLTKITIPASLKVIARNTFNGCVNLTQITLQEGLEKIGSEAFKFYSGNSTPTWTEQQLGSLSITVPSTVTVIGGGAFDYNGLLGSITFAPGSKLTQIGGQVGATDDELTGASTDYTFRGTKITSITFPALLENINSNILLTPANAKYGLSIIESVTFTGTALKAIPNSFFTYLPELKTVVLPESIESIGNSAFAAGTYGPKTNFESITIPASVTTIGTGVFNGCEGLETVIFAEGSQITEIPTNTFKNTISLEKVTLPKTIETIGENAFENSSVSTISLPSSLKTIEAYAFSNCDNIVSVDLFGNISYLGDYAFYDCDKLQNAKPSSGLMYFGELAFGFCEMLTEAYIPDTVQEINGNPYAGCSGVTKFELDPFNSFYTTDENGILYDLEMTVLIYYPASITSEKAIIPDTVNEIGAGAFAGSAMKSIDFPARFGVIAANTFRGCTNLTSVTIPEGITEIGDSAFEGCTLLNNVEIPNTVESVGNYAFAGCTSLSNVQFKNKTGSDYYTLGTHIFDGCTSLTSAVLPNSWRITRDDALDCGMGGTRTQPEPTVAQLSGNIPSYMFANSGVTTAALPANVTMLCTKGVFMNCANLSSVTFGVTQLAHAAANLGADYFTGCTSLPANFTPPYKTGGSTPSGPSIKF